MKNDLSKLIKMQEIGGQPSAEQGAVVPQQVQPLPIKVENSNTIYMKYEGEGQDFDFDEAMRINAKLRQNIQENEYDPDYHENCEIMEDGKYRCIKDSIDMMRDGQCGVVGAD